MRLQTMKKTMLLMMTVMAGFSVVACKDNTTTVPTSDIITETNAVIPQLTNPDAVFYQSEDFSLTYGELYAEMKINDGLTQLLNMVDSQLLATEISAVTAEEIANKKNFLTYGTDDPDEIADISLENKADYEEFYEQNLVLAGYEDDEDDYLRLVVAKDNYALAAMKDAANSEETWFVGPSTIANYYSNTYREALSSLKIRFMSETEAKDVMKSLNLVGSLGKLYRYTGTKPIDEVPSSSFDETNTVLLEGSDLIQAFVQMYNIVYDGYRDALSETATLTELRENSDLLIEYKDLSEANATLATFVFDTLGDMESYLADDTTPYYYTYLPAKYNGPKDTSYYMILNLGADEKVELGEFTGTKSDLETSIGADLYAEIEETLTETNLADTGFVSDRIVDLRKTLEFNIFDYYLGMDYQSLDAEFEVDADGHETMVASYGETEITADDLFYYSMNRNASLYSIYAAQMKVLMQNHFADVYCEVDEECLLDINRNTSDKMEAHREAMSDMKTQFEESYYSYYYTFEEYIYLAYGATSESDLLSKYYVQSSLQPYMIYGKLTENDWNILTDYLYDQMAEYYDNYFALDVTHLLVYIDRDEDGSPDDYDEFLDDLSDTVAYEAMLQRLTDAIYAFLNEDDANTMSKLVSTYAKAKHTDPLWGEFKDFGFLVMTEDLSSSSTLTYLNTKDKYDPKFVEGLQAAYVEFGSDEHLSDLTLLYETPVATSFGVHIMLLERGTGFTKPSGKFEMTYDNEGNPKYSEAAVNALDELSLDQLKLYSQYRFYEMVYGTDPDDLEAAGVEMPKIPTSVKTAIEAYFKNIHDSLYVIGALNIVVADSLVEANYLPVADANFTFVASDIALKNIQVRDTYFLQVFGEGDA